MRRKPPLFVIVGPTAVGKSSLAVTLAEKWGGEIINADSLQVYRYLDIGTAKPAKEDRERIPHHLMDIVYPDETFHAGLFVDYAGGVIERLWRERKPIFVVGGTGLYIKALLGGLCEAPPADEVRREELRQELKKWGPEFLHARLEKVDPQGAERIGKKDSVRIMRALEVIMTTGKTLSQAQDDHRFGLCRYRYLKIGLRLERAALYDRIDRRVEAMIDGGLEDEVAAILGRGYDPELKPLKSLGYRHMIAYLRGKMPLNQVREEMQKETRHYAKRQMSWFRQDEEIKWYAPEELVRIEEAMKIWWEQVFPDSNQEKLP